MSSITADSHEPSLLSMALHFYVSKYEIHETDKQSLFPDM
jgi:hypothetical protein